MGATALVVVVAARRYGRGESEREGLRLQQRIGAWTGFAL